MASRIAVFRRKIALGEYELTSHAKNEMEQDGFTIQDVKHGIYSGRIIEMQRHGLMVRKYVVHGRSVDRRRIGVVCRTTESGKLRIITVFAL
jgi:hypothetical protein